MESEYILIELDRKHEHGIFNNVIFDSTSTSGFGASDSLRKKLKLSRTIGWLVMNIDEAYELAEKLEKYAETIDFAPYVTTAQQIARCCRRKAEQIEAAQRA